MAVDYDLIILGGSPLGRDAALAAAHYKARVALIEPPTPKSWTADLTFHTLRQFAHQAAASSSRLALTPDAFNTAKQRLEGFQESLSIAHLSSLGVDVLEGEAEFTARPWVSLRVNRRVLRSRTYLLLRPYRTLLPNIPGLDNAQPLVPEDVWESDLWTQSPQRISVLGSGAIACELAQLLSRFGHHVTLISETPLLPGQEAEAVRLLQAVLEAEGIAVIAPTPIERVWLEDGQAQVQTEVGAIASDVLIATGLSIPDVSTLHLEAVGLKLLQGSLPTNAQMQTGIPNIYACDTLAGAQIALKNALFMPIFRMPRHDIPQVIFTDPPLVSFGITQNQAHQRYGTRHQSLRQDFLSCPKAYTQQQTPGHYQILVSPSGHILGGYVFGPEAEEWAGIFILAQRQRIPLQKLLHLPLPSPSFASGVQAIAQDWQTLQLNQHPWLLRRLDHWFDARRSWMR